MTKISTTAKDFRAGVAVAQTKSTITWDPAGHLSVKLLDASATQPLANVAVTVHVPTEGTVELTSDADGTLFHADVPFRDYELDLGPLGKVTVPAVAVRSEQHIAPVPGSRLGWIDLQIVDDRGIPLWRGTASVDGASIEIDSDDPGRVAVGQPLAQNDGKTTVAVGDLEVDVALPILPMRTVVRLPKKGGS